MFKESFNKLKALIVKNEEGNNKKKIESLVVFIIIIIITVIAINVIWNEDKSKSNTSDISYKQLALGTSTNNMSSTNNIVNEDSLDKNLENILSKISGVGKVNVLITYSESSQVVAMYNENSKESSTEENDTQGGNRKIKELDVSKDIIYKEENGEKIPITQKVVKPKVEGAIVIAEGASNVNIKTNIIQAVEAVTGVATHKIQVFEMKD